MSGENSEKVLTVSSSLLAVLLICTTQPEGMVHPTEPTQTIITTN